jgi:hypothetical protein
VQGLDWQTVQIPLAAGLLQRTDPRARPMQQLDIARDVQFDEWLGLQTRLPFAAMSTAIEGGGTLADVRRIVANGDELLVFTRDSLYSWAPAISKWILRGPHLAATVEERTVLADTIDSTSADRAELAGIVVYVDEVATDEEVRVTVASAETGAVIATRAFNDAIRPRVVALETVLLVTWVDLDAAKDLTGERELIGLMVPIANPGSLGALTPLALSVVSVAEVYDVERIPDQDAAVCVLALGGSYHVIKVEIGVGIASSNKTRRADKPIAIACTPDGASLLVVRADESVAFAEREILGDLIDLETLNDTTHVGLAIGTTPAATLAFPQQIAAAFRSVATGGQYRAHVFWHYGETPIDPAVSLQPTVKTNTVDTDGTLGTPATFAVSQGVGSRAFDHGGRVFVHLSFAQPTEHRPVGGTATFGPPLQNTLFLYRDDRHLVAKVAPGRSGGHPARRGLLSGVQALGGGRYAWCATERRIIPMDSDRFIGATQINSAARFSDRGPRDVVLVFDDDDARRCVRLGETLYVAGGLVLAYDGCALVEVGWQVLPFTMRMEETGTGDIEEGTYAYRPCAMDRNARGEIDRSSTVVIGERSVTGSNNSINVTVSGPVVSRRSRIAVELWRSEKDPTADDDLQLVTSPDPADAGATSNQYLAYDLSAGAFNATLVDRLADSSIADRPAHPVVGGVLEYLAPPAARVIAASDDRLFLGGVAGDPDRIHYSRQRRSDEVAAFHGALVAEVPQEGGPITALSFLNETLIVFRETAVYSLAGNGLDNALGGSNFGPARRLAADVGALSQESIVAMPAGILFKSRKGWYLVNRGFTVTYIGAAVTDFDTEPVVAAHLVESQHQVRILTSSRMLVWCYPSTQEEGRGQWAEWTIEGGRSGCLWKGSHVYLGASGAHVQQASYADLTYGMDVETSWMKPADLQGFLRVRKLQILGELRSSDVTHLRIRIAYDYQETYVDDRYWEISPMAVGGPLQLKIGPSRQQVQAIKIRITPVFRSTVVPEFGDPIVTTMPPEGEAIKLTGLALEVGYKRGLYPRLPAAQRS